MRGAESVGKNHIVIMSVIAARGVPGRVLVVVAGGGGPLLRWVLGR